ncbi:MAG: RnfH family protein [Burkholderiaceae bacterium]
MADGRIPVQVCHARPDRIIVLELEVEAGSSLRQVIAASGILQQFPEIDLATSRIGIYGKLKTPDSIAQAHDRIEIYRPLQADPKESRRRRAGVRQRGARAQGSGGSGV